MLELSASARVRLECLLHFVTHGQNVSVTARRFGIARSTLYKWLARADLSDVSSFEEQSRAPEHVPQPETDAHTIARIRAYRTHEPLLSKEAICERLRSEHGIALSASTVGRVIRRFGFYFADTPAHREKRREAELRKYDTTIAAPRAATEKQIRTILNENGETGSSFKKAAVIVIASASASVLSDIPKAHALEGSIYEVVPTLDPIGGTLDGTEYTVDGGTLSDLSFTTEGATYKVTPPGQASSSSTASVASASSSGGRSQAGGGRRTIPIPESWSGHSAAPSSLGSSASSASSVPLSFPSVPTLPPVQEELRFGASLDAFAQPQPAGKPRDDVRTGIPSEFSRPGIPAPAPADGKQQQSSVAHDAAPLPVIELPVLPSTMDETPVYALGTTAVLLLALLLIVTPRVLPGLFLRRKIRHPEHLLLMGALLTGACLLAFLWTSESAHAAQTVPLTRWYQGHLLKSDGAAVTTEVTIRFSEWKSADFTAADLTATGAINTTATNYVNWSEEHTLIPSADGSFAVELGSINTLPDFTTLSPETLKSMYLQVEVKASGAADTTYDLLDANTSDTAIDRTSMLSLPFARNADLLDQRDTGTASGSIPVLTTGGGLSLDGDLTLNADNGATNAVLIFGNSVLAETLTFNTATSRFEFSDDVGVSGDLEVTGTMSGRTLQVTGTGASPLIKTVGGNVGIGTASPGTTLDVNGTSNFSNTMTITNNNTSGNYVSPLTINNINTNTAGLYVRTSGANINGTSGSIESFLNTNTYDATFTGFGISNDAYNSPDYGSNILFRKHTGYRMAQQAAITSGWTDASDATRKGYIGLNAYDATASREGLRITTDGTNALSTFTGNVGIGTTAPETKLEVTGTASGYTFFGQNGLATSGALVIAPRPGTATGNTLIVDTQGLVYDATNKRVGIGTAAPDTALHVEGASVGTLDLLKLQNSSNGGIASMDLVSGGTSLLTLQADGNRGGGVVAGTSYGNGLVFLPHIADASLSLHLTGDGVNTIQLAGGLNYGSGDGNDIIFSGGATTNANYFGGDMALRGGNNSGDGADDNHKGKIVFQSPDGLTNILTVLPSGNTGIGTTAPETKLEVVGSMSGRTLQVTGTGANPLITTVGGNVGIGSTNPSQLLSVGASNQFTVDSAGNIVSGQWSTPIGETYGRIYYSVGDAALHFENLYNSAYQIGNSSGNAGGILMPGVLGLTIRGAQYGGPVIQDYLNNTLASFNTGTNYLANNVGIGTTTPNVALSVAGTASGRILSFGDRLTGSGAVSIRTLTDSITAFQVFDSDGGNPVFNIDTVNERVGIGTAAPGTVLDVNGSIRAKNNGAAPASGTGIEMYMQNGNGFILAYDRDAGAYQPLAIDGNSLALNVGSTAPVTIGEGGLVAGGYTYLGGNTSTGLRIKGTDYANTIYQPNAGQDLLITANGGDLGLGQVSVNPSVFVKSDGNVGIGTTAPETKLEVTGTMSGNIVHAEQSLTSSGNLVTEGQVKMNSGATIGYAGNAATFSSGGLLQFSGAGGISLPYGCFSDSTTQTMTGTTMAYKVKFDTDEYKSGITHSTTTNTSRVYVDNAGTYLITFSAIGKSSATNKSLDIWMAVDGVNVPRSNTVSKFVGSANERIITVTYLYKFQANQYFELLWNSDDAGTTLAATAAGSNPTRPASPSAIMTVNMISRN